MKKGLTFILALVVLLTFAMPAMAYTQRKPGTLGSHYTVDIQLIEYDSQNDIFPGMISQKPVNRAYAKNEIVAAIGSIIVPAREDVLADGYNEMQFSGKNISFKVTENRVGTNYNLITTVPPATWVGNWTLAADDASLNLKFGLPTTGIIPTASSNKTYKWLVFGKVLKDGASISLEFIRQEKFAAVPAPAPAWISAGAFAAHSGFVGNNAAQYLVLSEDYVVFKQANNNYIIYEIPNKGGFDDTTGPVGNPLFRIEVGKRNATERLYMYTGSVTGPVYRVLVEPSTKELMFICVANVPRKVAGDQIDFNTSAYKTLKAYYTEHFEKALGLSAYNEGNVLLDKDWSTLASKMSLSAKVELTPWVAYPTR